MFSVESRQFIHFDTLSSEQKSKVACPGANLSSGSSVEEFSKELTPDREILHKEIIESFIQNKYADLSYKYAVLLMGLPGAGKTSVVKGNIHETLGSEYDKNNFVTLSLDDVISKLPEFQRAIHFDTEVLSSNTNEQVYKPTSIIEAFSLCRAEARYILNIIRDFVIEHKYNFVLDASGMYLDTYQYYLENDSLNGHNFSLFYVTVPLNVAMDRIKERAEAEGRRLDGFDMYAANINIQYNFSLLMNMLEKKVNQEAYICDNSGERMPYMFDICKKVNL